MLIPFHPFGFSYLEWFTVFQWEKCKPMLCKNLWTLLNWNAELFIYCVAPPLVGNNKGRKTNMDSCWGNFAEWFNRFLFLPMTHNFPSEFNKKKVGFQTHFEGSLIKIFGILQGCCLNLSFFLVKLQSLINYFIGSRV